MRIWTPNAGNKINPLDWQYMFMVYAFHGSGKKR